MSLIYIIVAVVVVAIIGMAAKGRIGVVNESTIRVLDIPSVFSQLRATGSDGSFAVFIPTPEQCGSEEPVNIQFSIENGSIGLDWALVSAANIRDQEKFKEVMRKSRFHYRESEMNDVRYLRTEDQNSDDLCVVLLSEIYGLSDQDPIGLIVESFQWPALKSG